MTGNSKDPCASWARAYAFERASNTALQKRASRTWKALSAYSAETGYILTPKTITAEQARSFLLHRAGKLCLRSVQLEATHICQAVRGVDRNIGNASKKDNPWSITRLTAPADSNSGQSGAQVQSNRYDTLRPNMPEDIRVVTELCEGFGLFTQDALTCGPYLRIWSKKIQASIARNSSCKITINRTSNVQLTSKKSYEVFLPQNRLADLNAVIESAKKQFSLNAFIVQGDSLKKASGRYSNYLYGVGLNGQDYTKLLRCIFAQRQYEYYVASGMICDDAIKEVSRDLGYKNIDTPETVLACKQYLRSPNVTSQNVVSSHQVQRLRVKAKSGCPMSWITHSITGVTMSPRW